MGQSKAFADPQKIRRREFVRAVLDGAQTLDRDEVRALADQLHMIAHDMSEGDADTPPSPPRRRSVELDLGARFA